MFIFIYIFINKINLIIFYIDRNIYIYISADPVVSGGARQRSRALDLSVPRRAACAGPSSSVCRVKLPYCHISVPVPRLPVGRSLAVALAFRRLFVERQNATCETF